MTDDVKKPRARKPKPEVWVREAEDLEKRLSVAPTRPAMDMETERLFSSTLRQANSAVAHMSYGDLIFSSVNNLRKVATDAHAERMVLRRRVWDLDAHRERMEKTNQELALALADMNVALAEASCFLKTLKGEVETLKKNEIETLKKKVLIKWRVPRWLWGAYLSKDPR